MSRTARELAAHVVGRVLDDAAWARPVLEEALAKSRLEPRDRAFATELTYGTLRWLSPLEESLRRASDKPGKTVDKRVWPHLLVAAYQLQHLDERVPARAVVHAAVEAVKRDRPGMKGFANALLRHLADPLDAQLPEDAELDEVAKAYGAPRFFARGVRAVDPDGWRAELAATCGRPELGIFVFDESAPPPEGARAHAFVPGAYLGEGLGDPRAFAGFPEGALTVMDPGSALVALLAAGARGRALDLCAAPGGKSAILGRTLDLELTSVELDPRRATRLQDTLDRCRVRSEVVVGDAAALKLAPAELVVLDAPCTGFGTVRRRPEIKRHRRAADLAARAQDQEKLLDAAADLVKPGGLLIYAVCSPLPDEGRDQVAALLARRPEFVREDARTVAPWLPDDAVDDEGQVQLFTHRHQTDAFFAARLRRRGS